VSGGEASSPLARCMTKARIGTGVLILAIFAMAVLVLVRRRPPSPASSVHPTASVMSSDRESRAALRPAEAAPSIPAMADGIWVRPAPEVAALHARRAGFSWILKQLGASDELVTRLIDGHLAAAITELKKEASTGDPAATNILGEIAHQQCRLGRDEETLTGFEVSEIKRAQALPPADAEWLSNALHADTAFDKQVAAMCKQLVDPDQVESWVAAQAGRGDAASLWLMHNLADNMHDMQQRLRDAAAAGFPEAQFELAWVIIAGQAGAAGTGPEAANVGELLLQSADTLPRSETQLAACEYYGCPGVSPDLNAAVTHAREAARRGSIDGMIEIGPHLPPAQINPDEVAAWSIVRASLALRGCYTGGFSVREMKATTAVLSATSISTNARHLAEQYWQQYGPQIVANLACGS
jgi:TPR repeat protein